MKRILYVEDNTTAQLIFRRLLGSVHQVTIAESTRLANALLKTSTYDLVVTDYLFPEGDALEVIGPLRQEKSPLELPIIAVSGALDTALIARLHRVGVNVCVPKPLKAEEFRSLVERMLEHPFVENNADTAAAVCCFQWFERGLYHEYNPELNRHLSGRDRNELAARMHAWLQERLAGGDSLDYTSQERIRSRPPPRVAAATPSTGLS